MHGSKALSHSASMFIVKCGSTIQLPQNKMNRKSVAVIVVVQWAARLFSTPTT